MGSGINSLIHPTEPDLQAGVTLIELVVVVAVMATLAVGASLTAGRSTTGAQSDLSAFRDAYSQARALAVHGGEQRALVISAQGHRVALWHDGDWQVSGRLQRWRSSVSYLQEGGRRAGPDQPNLRFLANGQTSAFSIQLGRTQCHSDGWTGLICNAG
jgi:prepilin-type N-terminal cleavage/methylation domain-containing protein